MIVPGKKVLIVKRVIVVVTDNKMTIPELKDIIYKGKCRMQRIVS